MPRQPSMLSLLRRHFKSGVYPLGEYLTMRHWPLDWSVLDPREREIVDEILKSYIVIPLDPAGVFRMWEDPDEAFEKFLMRQRRPTGVSCATTELFSERWRLLDKAIGRPNVGFLMRACIVLKAAQSGPTGAWLQVSGRELSSVVKWPPRNTSKPLGGVGLGHIFYNRILRDIHNGDDEQFPGFIIDTASLPDLPEAVMPMIDVMIKRAKFLRRVPWLPPSKKSVISGRTPAHEVVLVLDSTLWRLCPHKLLGCPQNWKTLRTKMTQLTTLRRNETLTPEMLADGLKTKDVAWLNRVPGPKRGAVFREFIVWFFAKIIVPIVSHFFYVTETSFDPSGIYFYRHNVWRRLQQKGLEVFREQACAEPKLNSVPTSTPLEARPSQAAETGNGVAVHVPPRITSQDSDADELSKRPRLIPKTHGVRAIMNLRDLHDRLKVPHIILSRAWGRGPNTLASPTEFVPRLLEYRDAHPNAKFYYVKADVTACFDMANITKLLEILEQRLTNKYAITRNMRVVSLKSPKYARVVEKNDACWGADAPAAVPCPAPAGRVVTERKGEVVLGDLVVNELRALLTSLRVRLGSEVVTRNKGIPQGSSVSLDLCNILLDDFVATQLHEFSTNNFLVRYVDDFLFITTDEALAQKFHAKMKLQYPVHGVSFNPAKIRTNVNGDSKEFTFLGETISPSLQLTIVPSIRGSSPAGSLQLAYRRLRYDLNFVINVLRASTDKILRSSLVKTIAIMVSLRLNACGINPAAQAELFRTRILRLVPTNLRRQLAYSFERSQRQFRAH